MGTTWPGISRREATSAAIRNTAPARAEAGTSARWPGPTRKRMAWGTTSPTKPIEPTRLTITAVISVVTPISTTWTRRTGTPSAAADCAPKAKASIDRACHRQAR